MEPGIYFLLASTMGAIAATYLVKDFLLPRGKGSLQKTIQTLLFVNVFRFAGMAMYIPNVVGAGMPEAFRFPTVWGDFIAAILALAGYMLLAKNSKLAMAAVWLFNLEGFVDIAYATYQALTLHVAAHAGMMFFVFTIYAPLLVSIHITLFRILLMSRRRV